MSLKLFLSHSSTDKPFVEELKCFLEDGGKIECWLDSHEIRYGDNFVSRIDDGLRVCDVFLLLLSVASVQSKWVKEEWTLAYCAQVKRGIRIIPLLLEDCQPPAILDSKRHCDLRTNRLDGMRRLKTDLLRDELCPAPGGVSTARLPNFIGREAELSELKERLCQPAVLVAVIGMPGLGKTYLAREFIRRHGTLFEASTSWTARRKISLRSPASWRVSLVCGWKGRRIRLPPTCGGILRRNDACCFWTM